MLIVRPEHQPPTRLERALGKSRGLRYAVVKATGDERRRFRVGERLTRLEVGIAKAQRFSVIIERSDLQS